MRLATCEVEALFAGRLDELSYREQLNGPSWLTAEMCSTEPAREKLRAWLAATPPPWSDADVADARERLHFSGDGIALGLTAAVIARLPPPVYEYAIRTTSFVGVVRWSGFCGRPPEQIESRPWFVVVSTGVGDQDTAAISERFRGTVAHEIGHLWLEREPTSEESWLRSSDRAQLDRPPCSMEELAAANPEAAEVLQRWRTKQRGREDLVERLCRAWGFHDSTTMRPK